MKIKSAPKGAEQGGAAGANRAAPVPIPTGMDGVELFPLKIIPTDGGPVLHMLRNDSPFFCSFGEVYFSEVEAGAVKAWKRHNLQTQIFAVPVGRMKIVLYDSREGSSSKGKVREIVLGRPDAYNLLRIPCGVWYGFTALDGKTALLCNCADLPHDPHESERKLSDSSDIPFSWS